MRGSTIDKSILHIKKEIEFDDEKYDLLHWRILVVMYFCTILLKLG